jgi:hypothetical protein
MKKSRPGEIRRGALSNAQTNNTKTLSEYDVSDALLGAVT